MPPFFLPKASRVRREGGKRERGGTVGLTTGVSIGEESRSSRVRTEAEMKKRVGKAIMMFVR